VYVAGALAVHPGVRRVQGDHCCQDWRREAHRIPHQRVPGQGRCRQGKRRLANGSQNENLELL